MKLVVEIEYQESSMARNIAVDDVRRALIAFVPHKIISVKEAAQQSVQSDDCPACEGTGSCAVHGLEASPCSACNGTGISR